MEYPLKIVSLVITIFLVPLWIGLCFFIPYLIGEGLNKLCLKGRSFPRPTKFFFYIAGISFSPVFFTLVGFSIIQIFSISASELWYQYLFPVSAVGNTIGIIFSGIIGLLRGKVSSLH